MKKYFGTDGIRGEANRDLTPELSLKLGRAAVRAMDREGIKIVVGRDTRVSGRMLEGALTAGFLSEGARVFFCGVIPTPGVSFLTENFDADLGAVISASHNPFNDNGIKFFGPGGAKLPDPIESSIETEFERLDHDPRGGEVGEAVTVHDAESLYVSHLTSCVGSDLSGMKVAIDCSNGAAYRICPAAFERLGATVETLGTEPDGQNINDRCGSQHPQDLAEMVKGWNADMGFALDGDGDRCICVDDRGEVRDGDYAMAIAARYMLERDLLHPRLVVSTVMSNLGFYQALEKLGIESVQVQVGDRYVVEEMESTGALIGGEQSGHIIFGEHESTGDGTLTALLIAAIVADTGEPLSSLSEVMKKYPQVLVNVRSRSGKRLSEDMEVWKLIREYEQKLGSNGRVLVRSSGTEPLERVMVEASSERQAESVANAIAEAISKEIDG